jgi:hypothetical protein
MHEKQLSDIARSTTTGCMWLQLEQTAATVVA